MGVIRYRPEVDGLRAVAVLPVILFHAGVAPFRGGFIGVDIFFVISGYLITSIVLAESDAGKFSLWSFYDRRLRRIAPALLVVIALTMVAAFFLMMPGQLKELGQSAVASLAFSANIFFWLKLDYWSQSSELTPLLHLWSLGVEEQFYLLTPLVALVARKRGLLLTLFVVLGIASFAAMLTAHAAGHVSAAFYLLPFRAWEIAAGSIAAVIQPRLGPHRARDEILSCVGVLILVAGVLLLTEQAPAAVTFGAPVLGAVLLILFCRSGPVQKLLSARPLVLVGLISYSLYLFHQPILALGRIASPKPLDAAQIALAIGLTFVLAGLTYRFVEKPCRRRTVGRDVRLHFALASVLVALFGAGLVMSSTNGLREQKLAMMDDRVRTVLLSLEDERSERLRVWGDYIPVGARPFESTAATKVLFVGDSLSEDLFVATSMTAAAEVSARRLPLDDECVRTKGMSGKGKEFATCKEEFANFVGSPLLRDADVVVVANAWLDNARALENFLTLPEIRGKQVVVYKSHAFLDMLSVVMGLSRFGMDTSSADLERFIYLNRHQRTLAADRTLQTLSERHGARTIDAFAFFCDERARRCRLFSPNGKPLLIDQAHLSMSGVALFQPWFSAQLARAVREGSAARAVRP